ncbi:hypothetical protein JEZ13_00860 [bacterium]|nr:hypothetical protein [bacterium]
MSYSPSNKKKKEDATVSFNIKLSKNRFSEIDTTYDDVTIIYSLIRSYNGKHTSYSSVLLETDLFDMIREDLWFMDKHVLDKILELSEEELKNEINHKNLMNDELLFIDIDIEKIKEIL